MESPVIWILLWGITLFPVVYTYLIYPAILELIYVFKKKAIIFTEFENNQSPDMHIIMAVHNEDKILPDKLKAFSAIKYSGNYHFWIGSDASTDNTNVMLDTFSLDNNSVNVLKLNVRAGKGEVINKLADLAREQIGAGAIILFTDADILFPPDLLEVAAINFSNPKLGILDIRIVSGNNKIDNLFEAKYWELENRIKWLEGKLWGCTMGASGGCYFLRSELFVPIPENFLVDDFFLSMHTLKEGYAVQLEDTVISYSNTNSTLGEEFRRKRRISAGNWQNHVLYSRYFRNKICSPIGFCYYSHKILRWVTPLLLSLNLLVLLGWSLSNSLGKFIPIVILLLSLATPCLAVLLSKLNLRLKPVEGWLYFLAMQVALAAGTYDYLKGINTNVWKPTKRIGEK